MLPRNAPVGEPTFDPVHTVWPPQPPFGEAIFGPLPGTYIEGIPYNAEYQKKYRDLVKETTEGKARDTFPACVALSVPRMIGAFFSFDIIQSPDVMIWYDGYGRSERRIFLDGRQHPPQRDPGYSGHSVGRLEGNTLVVDTVDLLGGYFDDTPAPYSDQLHMVERIRLVDTNILEDQMTFTDPVTMVRPWVVTRYFQRRALATPRYFQRDTGAAAHAPSSTQVVRRYLDLYDRPCVPNVKMDANGFEVAILPQELDSESGKAQNSSH